MRIQAVLVSTVAIAAMLGTPQQSKAFDPVTLFIAKFVGEYALGAGLDELYDRISGKPNIREIDRRLKELESNSALRQEMRTEIKRVREEIKNGVTKDEFKTAMSGLQTQLIELHQRVTKLEEKTEFQEIEIRDLKSGTKDAESARVFLGRGEGLTYKKEYSRALANFAIALRIDDKLTDAYVARAACFVQMNADDVAMLDYEKAIELSPKCLPAMKGRGIIHGTKGRFDKAIADLSTVLASGEDPDALHIRGYSYLALNKLDESIRDYQTCVKLAPAFAKAWNNLGVAQQRKGEHTQAAESFTTAMKHDSREVRHHANRAFTYRLLGKRTEAMTDCDAAIDIDPKWQQAWETRGLCKYEIGRRADSVTDLTKAIELGCSNGIVYRYRGFQYCVTKEYAKAVSDLDTAIIYGQTHWSVYEDRAIANYNCQKWADSVRDYTEVIKANPNKDTTGNAYWFRAFANLSRGERANYRNDINSAVAVNPDHQKKLSAGDVVVTNKSKSTIVIDIDYFIRTNGDKEEFALPCTYEFKPGESAYLVWEKNPIVAKKFQAYVKTANGKKLYYWDYKAGAQIDVEINDSDLP